MAHVSSAVKEMYLHRPTEALAAGGLGGWSSTAGTWVPRRRWSVAPATSSAGCARISWRPTAQPMQLDRAARFRGEPPAMVPLVAPNPWPSRALPSPVTGSSSTWARHGRDDESQELSGGVESHVS